MPRGTAHSWLALANDNLQAVMLLYEAEFWRSAASRAYYASMAATHALLIRCKQDAPEVGNWPNNRLPGLLLNGLTHHIFARQPAQAEVYARLLERCWNLRLHADYAPNSVFDDEFAREAVKAARGLTRLAEKELE